VLRSAIPLALYAVFEVAASQGRKALTGFFDDDAHVFLAVTLLLLGLLLGFADVSLRRSFATIESLAERLRRYAEWSFGTRILARAEADESALQLQRLQRAVVFLDIRGFTAWAESQPPEAVVGLLNAYYAAAEAALASEPIKLKYTADEVMAVFESSTQAVAAARRMMEGVASALSPVGLAAGAGVHTGPVVEGVLGGERHRAYDFIGDTVNTAKRLCEAARAGEILVSQAALGEGAPVGGGQTDGPADEPWREIHAKGKRAAVRAHSMHVEPPAGGSAAAPMQS
jgi:class 3 adenylate cyclase